MAGGSGERFWPLSRKKYPKQLLYLVSEDKMLIEESIERILKIIPANDIYIITGDLLLEKMRKYIKILPPENIIAEPSKRNTAPCLALSASFLLAKYGIEGCSSEDISVAVLTADQNIYPTDGFHRTVEAALDFVETNNYLATIGISPSRPETGYGYIETEKQFSGDSIIFPAKRFCEKPDLDIAKEFVKAVNYLWNSGMFFWRLDTFIDSMIKNIPEIGLKIDEMSKKYSKKTHLILPEALASIAPIYDEFPNISIDYALMEKAKNVVVAKALFNWDDVGSWDALDRTKSVDTNGNVSSGKVCSVDSHNSIIINNSKNALVSALGLDNIVIVVTGDAILVCPKERVQDIKKSVEKIKTDFGENWL